MVSHDFNDTNSDLVKLIIKIFNLYCRHYGIPNLKTLLTVEVKTQGSLNQYGFSGKQNLILSTPEAYVSTHTVNFLFNNCKSRQIPHVLVHLHITVTF